MYTHIYVYIHIMYPEVLRKLDNQHRRFRCELRRRPASGTGDRDQDPGAPEIERTCYVMKRSGRLQQTRPVPVRILSSFPSSPFQ